MSGERLDASNSSVALLVDLVTNTLDPGYAAAAERAAAADAPPRRTRIDRLLLAGGCLLVGFTLVIAYVNTHRAAPQAATVHADLVKRVRSAQSSADALQASAQRLSTSIDTLRNQALTASTPLRDELQTEQLLAGSVAVSGPGLEVTLSNPRAAPTTAAAGRPGTVPLAQSQLLTDRDLRSIVNELWRDGAEAISVNDIRLTATSAIRFAGEAVLVDFDPINAPYSIKAIGNADQLDTSFAESDVASRYTTLAAAEGIGFTFTEHKNLKLAASPLTGPNYAQVPASAQPSDSATATPTGATGSSGSTDSTASTGSTGSDGPATVPTTGVTK
jgi:uncharacterized protein YlxW (UPF0749 family)